MRLTGLEGCGGFTLGLEAEREGGLGLLQVNVGPGP